MDDIIQFKTYPVKKIIETISLYAFTITASVFAFINLKKEIRYTQATDKQLIPSIASFVSIIGPLVTALVGAVLYLMSLIAIRRKINEKS